MSYILSALRRAEQDRKRSKERADQAWDQEDWAAPAPAKTSNRFVGLLGAMVLLLLLLLAAIIFWVFRTETADMPVVSGSSLVAVQEPFAEEKAPASIDRSTPQNEPVVRPSLADTADAAVSLPVVTGHLYVASNESLSRLFGEQGTYRVGHRFTNGLVLISISEKRAVFEKDGNRHEMPLHN